MLLQGSIIVLCMSSIIMNIECKSDLRKARKRGWWFIPSKCLYGLNFYNEGDIFDENYDASGNICYYKKCQNGVVDNMVLHNCLTTTTPATTTVLPGCYVGGIYYEPGQPISSGQKGNWCFTKYCDRNGQFMYGDDFTCSSTTTLDPPTTTNTAPPTTTPPTSTPPGCTYNDVHYPPDTMIHEGSSGTWCWEVFCDHTGKVIVGDHFNCGPSTSPVTTSAQTTSSGASERELLKRVLQLLKMKVKDLDV